MHLRMFEKKLHVLKGIISPVNDGYGKKGLVQSGHRINMTKLALSTTNWIEIDEWESKQASWSKTFDVLQHFKTIYPNNQIFLLCGADLFESFLVPNLWEEQHIKDIITKFGLAIVSRPGSSVDYVFSKLPILNDLKNHIHIITNPNHNDVSSTLIRKSISENLSIKYLLHDEIIKYISDHKLYLINQQT